MNLRRLFRTIDPTNLLNEFWWDFFRGIFLQWFPSIFHLHIIMTFRSEKINTILSTLVIYLL